MIETRRAPAFGYRRTPRSGRGLDNEANLGAAFGFACAGCSCANGPSIRIHSISAFHSDQVSRLPTWQRRQPVARMRRRAVVITMFVCALTILMSSAAGSSSDGLVGRCRRLLLAAASDHGRDVSTRYRTSYRGDHADQTGAIRTDLTRQRARRLSRESPSRRAVRRSTAVKLPPWRLDNRLAPRTEGQ